MVVGVSEERSSQKRLPLLEVVFDVAEQRRVLTEGGDVAGIRGEGALVHARGCPVVLMYVLEQDAVVGERRRMLPRRTYGP